MGYCTVSDIQDDFKNVQFLARAASPTSLVTSEAVTSFITEVSALVNSYVGQRWVTPVTGDADSLALMSLYTRVLVAQRIRGILENKQTTNIDANQNVLASWLSPKDVMAGLNAIKNGDAQLSGATLLLEGGGFYSNNEQRNVHPVFHKNRKQW